MKRFFAGLLTLVFGLYCGSAHAGLMDVDLGPALGGATMSGAALIGSAGDIWNVSDAASGVPLVDSTGAATGVTMDATSLFAGTCAAGCDFDGSPYYGLLFDSLGGNAGTNVVVSLSGVTAGDYKLYLYSAPPQDGEDRLGTFTANGQSVTVGPNNSATTLIEGTNYGVLDVTVGADTLLTITAVAGASPSGEFHLNGFQLQSIPEPSSLILTGVGLFGLLCYAWRKRN